MATESITIEVDSEAATLFRNASPAEQEKMRGLIGILLRELAHSQARSLRETVSDIGGKAKERGMTPEILLSILD
jgi:hypothetical protein